MKVRYDPDADAMYIKLRDAEVDHTKELNKNTILDFDKDGELIGIEILFVKERTPDILKEFKVENIASA